MRIAVVGAGVIGKLHAKTITSLEPRAELAVIVDAVAERAGELAEEYGVATASSVEQVLERDDVDTIAICTPSGMHADAAVAALDAGKHVIIEKPLDINLEAARRVLDAEQRSSATAMVVSQCRHLPAAQLIRASIDDGRFGRITSGNALMPYWRSQRYYDSGDWRGTWALDGGGALMNQGIHMIDLLAWYLGDPVEVFAWAGCLAHERIEVEDTAVATVRFASGALATVHGTTAAYPGQLGQVGVNGDRGAAIMDHKDLLSYHAKTDDAQDLAYGVGSSGNQAHEVLPPEQPAAEHGEKLAGLDATSHTTQFEHFLDVVEQGQQPLVTIAEATRTLSLIRGIYESVRRGEIVKIKELVS